MQRFRDIWEEQRTAIYLIAFLLLAMAMISFYSRRAEVRQPTQDNSRRPPALACAGAFFYSPEGYLRYRG